MDTSVESQQPSSANVSAPSLKSALSGSGTVTSGKTATTGYYNPDADWDYKYIVDGVKKLYLCEPSDSLLGSLYAEDAWFEDPAGKLTPILAFKGLAEVFEPGPIEKFDLVDVTKSSLRIELAMSYKPKLVPVPVPFRATITLKLNDQHKITHHMDYWGGVPLKHADEGFLGRLAEGRRRVTGIMQETFVRVTGGEKIGSEAENQK